MSDKKKNDEESKGFDLIKFVVGICIIIYAFGKVCFRGTNRISLKDQKFHLFLMYGFAFCGALVLFDFAHLRLLDYLAHDPLMFNITDWMASFGPWKNTMFLYSSLILLLLFMLGVVEFGLCKKYQRAIDATGIKNANGVIPQVKKVIKLDGERTILKVSSPGMAPESWKDKKNDLAFELREFIDDLNTSKDRKYIDILLSVNDMAGFLPYDNYKDHKLEPFHFIVGESKNDGLITENIRSCPHMLIGGVSGYGKSTSYKLMMYSLLKYTPPEMIKLSLLDLKRGVEVADFGDFPNVTISKNEPEAVTELESIVQEMYKRYDHLERIKKKSIDPKRDKMPIIIVAVDEASAIFGARSRNSTKKKLSDKARELCEEIAKLGRAAGVHMVLATQKATKTSIDSNTAENLDARFCFRTGSVSGSNAILGKKDGMDLPDIKGRGIWKKGGDEIKVQVPYVSEIKFEEMCKNLCEVITEQVGENTGEQKNQEAAKDSAFESMKDNAA